MAFLAKSKVIINTAPVALLYKVSAGALTLAYTFPTVSAKVKIALGSSSSTSGDNLDINMPDGNILRFAKGQKIFNGVDESDVTPVTSSTTATGYGEVVLSITEAPNEMNNMTALLKDLEAEKDSKFLLVIPTGFTYQGQNTDHKADGWAYMLGKRTTDIEMDYKEGAIPLSVTFASQSDSTLVAIDFTGLTMPAIDWRAGATTLTPASLVSGDETTLLAGKVLLKPTTYA